MKHNKHLEEKQQELDIKVNVILSKLDSIHEDLIEVKKIESRVDKLENTNSYFKGAAFVVVAIGASIYTVLFKYVTTLLGL